MGNCMAAPAELSAIVLDCILEKSGSAFSLWRLCTPTYRSSQISLPARTCDSRVVGERQWRRPILPASSRGIDSSRDVIADQWMDLTDW